jgi:hypothetical protein
VALQRLILTFKNDETIMHVLYRTQDGPNPGTKARRRDVTGLVRTGLERALEGLQGAQIVGTSGYQVREDVLLASTSPVSEKSMKRGA